MEGYCHTQKELITSVRPSSRLSASFRASAFPFHPVVRLHHTCHDDEYPKAKKITPNAFRKHPNQRLHAHSQLRRNGGRPPPGGSASPLRATGPWPRQRVLGKRAGQSLLAADLLAADEALDRDGDGAVNVLGAAVVGEAHAAKSFANADDGLEVANLLVALALL